MQQCTQETYNLPDGLLSLGFPHFWLLISLGHNVLEGCAYNCPLELVGPLGPLLGGLLLLTLLVLSAVEHGPVDLAGVSLEEVGTVSAAIQELEGLKCKKMCLPGSSINKLLNELCGLSS